MKVFSTAIGIFFSVLSVIWAVEFVRSVDLYYIIEGQYWEDLLEPGVSLGL